MINLDNFNSFFLLLIIRIDIIAVADYANRTVRVTLT